VKELPPAFREIPTGVDLLERLHEAFAKHRGWIQAVGFVEDVELKLPGSGADLRRTFRGRFALIQLAGPLGGPYGVTLSRLDGERVELLGGVLVRATSAQVSALCLSANLGTSANSVADASTQVASGPKLGERAELPRQPKPAASAFAARVGVGRPPEDDDSEAFRELPARGDLVEHFAFGLCEVLKVEGDRLVLRDLRGPGRIREIASEKLVITGPTEYDAKRLFKLARR
jgi:hypothetical protein